MGTLLYLIFDIHVWPTLCGLPKDLPPVSLLSKWELKTLSDSQCPAMPTHISRLATQACRHSWQLHTWPADKVASLPEPHRSAVARARIQRLELRAGMVSCQV